jgi:hypothetical protein
MRLVQFLGEDGVPVMNEKIERVPVVALRHVLELQVADSAMRASVAHKTAIKPYPACCETRIGALNTLRG